MPEFHMGDRLAKALDYAGMSNQQMADYLGVSRNTVGNYVALRTDVTLGTLRLWAMVTGVEMEWLQTGRSPSGHNGPEGLDSDSLPRLDSNQQPSGNRANYHDCAFWQAESAA